MWVKSTKQGVRSDGTRGSLLLRSFNFFLADTWVSSCLPLHSSGAWACHMYHSLLAPPVESMSATHKFLFSSKLRIWTLLHSRKMRLPCLGRFGTKRSCMATVFIFFMLAGGTAFHIPALTGRSHTKIYENAPRPKSAMSSPKRERAGLLSIQASQDKNWRETGQVSIWKFKIKRG